MVQKRNMTVRPPLTAERALQQRATSIGDGANHEKAWVSSW